MRISQGTERTVYGSGVIIELTGNEVATAIGAYLHTQGVHVDGPRTITVNGGLCAKGNIYVDPVGSVMAGGVRFDGQGDRTEEMHVRVTSEIGNEMPRCDHSWMSITNEVIKTPLVFCTLCGKLGE